MNLRSAISISDGLDAAMPELADHLDRMLLRGIEPISIATLEKIRGDLMHALINPELTTALVRFSMDFSEGVDRERPLSIFERNRAMREGLELFTPEQIARLVRDRFALFAIHLSVAKSAETNQNSPWAPYYRAWLESSLHEHAFKLGSVRLMHALSNFNAETH